MSVKIGLVCANSHHIHDGEEGMEDTGEYRGKSSIVGQAYMAFQAQLMADRPQDKKRTDGSSTT